MPAPGLSPDEVSALPHILTWVAANGSVLGAVYRWVTRPLEHKIASLKKDAEDLKKEVEELRGKIGRIERHMGDTPPDSRGSLSDAPTLPEVVRWVEELKDWREEIDNFRLSVVTDEEFRSYTTLALNKMESIVRSLGYIKGRLGVKEED